MTCFRKTSLIQRAVKSSVAGSHCKANFDTLLRPPRANQTLKRYLETDTMTKVISFFRQLWRQNPSAVDSYSLLFALKACIQESLLIESCQLHAIAYKLDCESIIHLQTCLIELYALMGNVDYAHRMFDEISCKNLICWTSLITAYINNDMPSKALDMFKQMLINDLEPDRITLTAVLTACADLGALSIGKWIHAYIFRKDGIKTDLCLINALINMYIKCGDIRSAQRLFYSSTQKDVFTWTSMIVGHALHGKSSDALDLFTKMKKANQNVKTRKYVVIPNDVTFLGVLMACCHAGMVEESKQHFKSMVQDFGLQPRLPHLGCMVDLLCRAGLLEEAYNFISEMLFQPNAVIWRTLLGACYIHDNIVLGAKVRQQLLDLEPEHVGDDVVLSNMYAARGLWSAKMKVRDFMENRKAPGCSSVEVGNQVCEFVTGDSRHPLKTEIYDVLGHLMEVIRTYRHAPEDQNSQMSMI